MIFLSLLLAGCATTPARRGDVAASPRTYGNISYTVRPGDTLWAISRMYDVDVKTLAAANSIKDSSVIEKGQVLIIPKAESRVIKAASNYKPVSNESFVWPVRGYIVSPFGATVDKIVNKGIDIRAGMGEGVRAARSGRVVYCDTHQKGFGKTVILDHGDKFQTVYAYNSEIAVKVGDSVRQNDIIASVGKTGRAKEPSLHFEIRKNGEPQNPGHYLPR